MDTKKKRCCSIGLCHRAPKSPEQSDVDISPVPVPVSVGNVCTPGTCQSQVCGKGAHTAQSSLGHGNVCSRGKCQSASCGKGRVPPESTGHSCARGTCKSHTCDKREKAAESPLGHGKVCTPGTCQSQVCGKGGHTVQSPLGHGNVGSRGKCQSGTCGKGRMPPESTGHACTQGTCQSQTCGKREIVAESPLGHGKVCTPGICQSQVCEKGGHTAQSPLGHGNVCSRGKCQSGTCGKGRMPPESTGHACTQGTCESQTCDKREKAALPPLGHSNVCDGGKCQSKSCSKREQLPDSPFGMGCDACTRDSCRTKTCGKRHLQSSTQVLYVDPKFVETPSEYNDGPFYDCYSEPDESSEDIKAKVPKLVEHTPDLRVFRGALHEVEYKMHRLLKQFDHMPHKAAYMSPYSTSAEQTSASNSIIVSANSVTMSSTETHIVGHVRKKTAKRKHQVPCEPLSLMLPLKIQIQFPPLRPPPDHMELGSVPASSICQPAISVSPSAISPCTPSAAPVSPPKMPKRKSSKCKMCHGPMLEPIRTSIIGALEAPPEFPPVPVPVPVPVQEPNKQSKCICKSKSKVKPLPSEEPKTVRNIKSMLFSSLQDEDRGIKALLFSAIQENSDQELDDLEKIEPEADESARKVASLLFSPVQEDEQEEVGSSQKIVSLLLLKINPDGDEDSVKSGQQIKSMLLSSIDQDNDQQTDATEVDQGIKCLCKVKSQHSIGDDDLESKPEETMPDECECQTSSEEELVRVLTPPPKPPRKTYHLAYPQHKDIDICSPCFYDPSPLIDENGRVFCPGSCGCCLCPWKPRIRGKEEENLIHKRVKVCKCRKKGTIFTDFDRTRPVCSQNSFFDVCPCREKAEAVYLGMFGQEMWTKDEQLQNKFAGREVLLEEVVEIQPKRPESDQLDTILK